MIEIGCDLPLNFYLSNSFVAYYYLFSMYWNSFRWEVVFFTSFSQEFLQWPRMVSELVFLNCSYQTKKANQFCTLKTKKVSWNNYRCFFLSFLFCKSSPKVNLLKRKSSCIFCFFLPTRNSIYGVGFRLNFNKFDLRDLKHFSYSLEWSVLYIISVGLI